MAHPVKHAPDIPAQSGPPGTARLIVFRTWPRPATTRADRAEGAGPGRLYQLGVHFTLADHGALAAWIGDARHGYDRLQIEAGVLGDAAWVSYALVYLPGVAWSAWGVTRREGGVEVWRCATGETVGHYPTMAVALASLPHASAHRRAGPVEPDRPGHRVRAPRRGMR